MGREGGRVREGLLLQFQLDDQLDPCPDHRSPWPALPSAPARDSDLGHPGRDDVRLRLRCPRDTSYYDQTIADLQQQVAALQESEANLRNSLYYNNPVGDGAQATNNVGYSS